ncbi:MAG: regulatory protein RecX [Pseudomonadota bacterium]
MSARVGNFWHGPGDDEEGINVDDDRGALKLDDVRRVAMGLLARREHSTLELRRKLERRRFPDGLIEEALAGLATDNLLSDERFAEEYVRSYAGRGQGPLKIRNGLAARGIEPQRADRLLYSSGHDWQALAEDARRRRFGSVIPPEYKERARQARFLQQRGFDHEQARSAAHL